MYSFLKNDKIMYYIIIKVVYSYNYKMNRLVKTVMFTSEEWKTMSLKKDDLVWISEEQAYVEQAILSHEEPNKEPLPFQVKSEMCIVEEVHMKEDNSTIEAIVVHNIINGERGTFGVYYGDVVKNITLHYKKHFSAIRIQRQFRKKRILKALAILQPIAREWYVNPNNPNHQKRMRITAEKWGMCP